MKSVLISIQKPHTDDIFCGKKLLEWRKLQLPYGKYYVYESKKNGGCGKVVGELEINAKRYDEPKELSEFYTNCEGGNEIRCRKCVANTGKSFCETHLKKPITRPPQSWCYVETI